MKKGIHKHTAAAKKKISKGLEKNKHAETWTEEIVLVKLQEMQNAIDNDSTDYDSKKYLGVGTLLYHHGLYKEILRYWKIKFKDKDSVFLPIKRIEQYFEQILLDGALRNKLNPTMAIFGLKNNYKWKDKHEVDVTTAGESINHSELSTEELIARAKAAKELKDNQT